MTNFERVNQSEVRELASIIINEFCGMCRSCKHYYTPDCKYNEDGEITNPEACVDGIEKWLRNETVN